MRRIGQIGRVRPECLPEYERLHATPWPDLIDALQQANIHNYSIFREGNTLFFYLEYTGSDYDADMKSLAQTEVMQRWWKLTLPMFEGYKPEDPSTALITDIKPIFYCP